MPRAAASRVETNEDPDHRIIHLRGKRRGTIQGSLAPGAWRLAWCPDCNSASVEHERPDWRISDRVCARSDRERHLAHIFKIGDEWLAFDATRPNRDANGFLFLGSFAQREAAMDAAEEGARADRIDGASSQGRAIPRALQFKTHLPLYSLAAAAGKFGEQQTEVKPEGWVEAPPGPIRITRDMFVTHIEGCSMAPTIPDGSLCAFRSSVSAPYDGKIVLMEDYGKAGGNRYTVKRYRTSMNADPNKEGDHAWLHERITLESINPDYPPWEVASSQKINVIGEFVYTVPKAAPPPFVCYPEYWNGQPPASAFTATRPGTARRTRAVDAL